MNSKQDYDFFCTMDLPAFKTGTRFHYPELKIGVHAVKVSNSISVEVKSIEAEGLTQLGLLECIVDNFNDSPEQFLGKVHDFAQEYIENNWPLADYDGPTDEETCNHYRQERKETIAPMYSLPKYSPFDLPW